MHPGTGPRYALVTQAGAPDHSTRFRLEDMRTQHVLPRLCSKRMTLELIPTLTLEPELTICGDNEYRGFSFTPRDNAAAHLLFSLFFLAKGPLRKPLQRRSLPASGRDSRRNLVGETRKVSLMPRR